MSMAGELIAEMLQMQTLERVVQVVAGDSVSFAHTVHTLKQLMKEFPGALTPEVVFLNVVKAGFFKPEGLYRLGKEIGVSAEELKGYKDA